jgi:hypothetical protein
VRGSCGSLFLTPRGYTQHIANGQALRQAYVQGAGGNGSLLPSDWRTQADAFYVRSTDIPRTRLSAMALMEGMYPDATMDETPARGAAAGAGGGGASGTDVRGQRHLTADT